jgi:transposase
MVSIAYGGLDVHKESITAHLISKETGEVVRDRISADKRGVLEAVKRWSNLGELRLCYEAGGSGFMLKRWLDEVGVQCDVIAPSLIPKAPGDRVKTDKRDARQLAKLYAAGLLVNVRVPSAEEETVRALLRLRNGIVRQVVQCKNRVIKYLRSQGHVYYGKTNWTKQHEEWIKNLALNCLEKMILDMYLRELDEATNRKEMVDEKIEEVALSETYRVKVGWLRCLKGVGVYTAMVLLCEVGPMSRFGKAPQLMSYLGLVPKEDSSGETRRTGAITKAGNSHARWVLIEAAWNQISSAKPGKRQLEHWKTQPEAVVAIAKKAQERLHKKFWKLVLRKDRKKAITAVAREMAGFVWAILMTEAV